MEKSNVLVGLCIISMSLAVGVSFYAISNIIQTDRHYADLVTQLQSQTQEYRNKLYENAITNQKAFSTDKCVIYDGLEYKEKAIANGIYWIGTNYYCVYVTDRTEDAIAETDKHEYCHYLIDNNYDHFCEVNS